jgi:hypothetical protein
MNARAPRLAAHRGTLSQSTRAIALVLTEIGRRRRLGMLQTDDGYFVHGPSDTECLAHLHEKARVGRWQTGC